MITAVIISGGDIDIDFALLFLNNKKYDFLIGADRGIHFLHSQGIMPTHIVGDFDSSSEEDLNYFKESGKVPVQTYQPEKDVTDTQIAVELAMLLGSHEIFILGGMGRRVDHFLANIRTLALPLKKGIPCYLVDPYNRVSLTDRPLLLKKAKQFGKYVSLFALGGQVTGLTLTGFKYPLLNYTLTGDDPLGVSNEIIEEKAEIFFESGSLIVVESCDNGLIAERCR